MYCATGKPSFHSSNLFAGNPNRDCIAGKMWKICSTLKRCSMNKGIRFLEREGILPKQTILTLFNPRA